jgi:hypothetical protein
VRSGFPKRSYLKVFADKSPDPGVSSFLGAKGTFTHGHRGAILRRRRSDEFVAHRGDGLARIQLAVRGQPDLICGTDIGPACSGLRPKTDLSERASKSPGVFCFRMIFSENRYTLFRIMR